MAKKRIYLNAFDMNCAGHQSPGLWTHPEDRSSTYKDAEYWAHLAKLLEKGRFDAIFLADVLGTYDVYKDSRDPAVQSGAQVPVNDPAFVVPIMAQATKHLGFGLTASVSYEHPYTFARRISTLDHLTKGRIGWNIVTSYLDSAARNLGLDRQMSHDERYDMADEYLEVVYTLWEASWEDDAVIMDKERGIYTDPAKVHDIRHNGRYYQVPGAHLCEPSPQRTPVIFQAGASSRGRKFAAKHAELVFIASTSMEKTKNTVTAFREEALKAGREADELKIITMITPIVGATEEEAEAKYKEYKKYASYEGALALVGGWTGVDMDGLKPGEEIQYVQNDAIRSTLKSFSHLTVEETADFVGVGGFGPVVVGSPEQVADSLEEWVDVTGVDGFNVAYAITPGTFEDFVEYVVPILQERGLVQKEYGEGTFRRKLFNSDHLPAHHIGKQQKEQLFAAESRA
ncbi:NtaA/DmoA family FMN-dependent monooxygenase [Bacillus aerolatus]|uniref:NtaA/DmoA family FMN-dependent monooxygenase n=1 Tax=Bacillus aerolatus TaxID=2653354 RepID=A0A6I1FLQ3_9BACI|nr:LLM class flavin-dependent oxidoreductase [Bacillus aerolatus]KAB7704713.1 NtaA/DmoA family FMN-dependent monooxygenase [Bacillus aerolatus]